MRKFIMSVFIALVAVFAGVLLSVQSASAAETEPVGQPDMSRIELSDAWGGPDDMIAGVPLADIMECENADGSQTSGTCKVMDGTDALIYDAGVLIATVHDVAPEPEPEPVDIDALAAAVIRGEFGDGEARQVALGDNYAAVQARVDEMLAPVESTPVASTPAPSAPSADPTGTPAQQWAWWVSEYGDPSYPSYDSIPACINEDGSGQAGPCKWDAATMGNHEGSGVYVYDDGWLVEQF